MIRLLCRSLLLLSVLGLATASAAAQTTKITAETRKRYLQTANEAFEAGHITKQQLADTARWTKLQPCVGVRLKLTNDQLRRMRKAIAAAEGFPDSEVLGYYGFNGWHIVFTTAGAGDPPYLVYTNDPINGARPITSWAGAATIFETTDLRDWLLKNAPGVPQRLAECWAWHVTLAG